MQMFNELTIIRGMEYNKIDFCKRFFTKNEVLKYFSR